MVFTVDIVHLSEFLIFLICFQNNFLLRFTAIFFDTALVSENLRYFILAESLDFAN
jgi:hypothetical protein